jgi:hypothetical protein
MRDLVHSYNQMKLDRLTPDYGLGWRFKPIDPLTALRIGNRGRNPATEGFGPPATEIFPWSKYTKDIVKW